MEENSVLFCYGSCSHRRPGLGTDIIEGTFEIDHSPWISPFDARSVSIRIYSSQNLDPSSKKGLASEKAYISEGKVVGREKVPIPMMGKMKISTRIIKFKLKFEVVQEFGAPGAFVIGNGDKHEFFLKSATLSHKKDSIHFHCASWVYPLDKTRLKRVFFSNQLFVPKKTPTGLVELRANELQKLRGELKGERKPWDRIYEYDYYNDLGDPDNGQENARPCLGGHSSQHPYPRRLRTARPPCATDRLAESRAAGCFQIYVPADERLSHEKQEELRNNFVDALVRFLAPKSDQPSRSHQDPALIDKILHFFVPEAVCSTGDFRMIRSIIIDLFTRNPKSGSSYDHQDNRSGFDSVDDIFVDIFSDKQVKEMEEWVTKKLKRFVPADVLNEVVATATKRNLANAQLPSIIAEDKNAWLEPKEFGRQMLAGTNPVRIRRLKEFSPSPGTKWPAEELSQLEKAMKEDKAFILEHDYLLPFLGMINGKGVCAYASRTVLVRSGFDETIEPKAIELLLTKDECDANTDMFLKNERNTNANMVVFPKDEHSVNTNMDVLSKDERDVSSNMDGFSEDESDANTNIVVNSRIVVFPKDERDDNTNIVVFPGDESDANTNIVIFPEDERDINTNMVVSPKEKRNVNTDMIGLPKDKHDANTNTVIFPKDGQRWVLAKFHVAANDAAHHQLVSHWLHTHAVIEPFIIATRRQLSVMHPIHRLLDPHFKDTLHINALARGIFLNAGGILERTLFTGEFSMRLSSHFYKQWRFDEQALPKDLEKRGMAVKAEESVKGKTVSGIKEKTAENEPEKIDEEDVVERDEGVAEFDEEDVVERDDGVAELDENQATDHDKTPDEKVTYPAGVKLTLEDYPYAKDGTEIWDAIETWVRSYCNIFYEDDDSVKEDKEIQNWWFEIRNEGHGDQKEGWYELTTRENLVRALATLIWIASGLHAALSFGQYAYAGWPPNRPTLLRKFVPERGTPEFEELTRDPEKFVVEMLPEKFQMAFVIAVMDFLSRHTSDEVYLGQRPPSDQWTEDEKVNEKFKEFRKNLEQIEKNIKDRNKQYNLMNRWGYAKIPYKLLYPDTSQTKAPSKEVRLRQEKVDIPGRGIPNSISI